MRGRSASRRETCGHCANFFEDPRVLERLFPGIAAPAGRGAARRRRGLCRRSDSVQEPLPACSGFRLRLHGADGDAEE
jgi:hypothetical protein